MGMVQIVTTPNEFNAALIKGFLENVEISCSYANKGSKNGQVSGCNIYVPEEKAEEALKLLKE